MRRTNYYALAGISEFLCVIGISGIVYYVLKQEKKHNTYVGISLEGEGGDERNVADDLDLKTE